MVRCASRLWAPAPALTLCHLVPCPPPRPLVESTTTYGLFGAVSFNATAMEIGHYNSSGHAVYTAPLVAPRRRE